MNKFLKIGVRVVFYALGLLWIWFFADIVRSAMTYKSPPDTGNFGYALAMGTHFFLCLTALVGICSCVKALLCLRFSVLERPWPRLQTETWILILADVVLYHLAFWLTVSVDRDWVLWLYLLWFPCAVASLVLLIVLGWKQKKAKRNGP